MNIDVLTTIKVIIVFLAIGLLASLIYGFRSIRSGYQLQFFRKRRDLIVHGWRLIVLAALLGGFALLVSRFGAPVAFQYFPPSPTVTFTPTITLTPTITITPVDSLTPTITETLQYTYTPVFPPEAQATVQTPVGPDANSVFSGLNFSDKLSKDSVVTDNITSFPTTVAHLYGGFSYDGMALGVQWTAVWLRDGKVVHVDTTVWKAASGGYGYTDWDCTTGECIAGNYEVQIFVGSTYKSSGTFTIEAAETTGTVTPTLTPAVIKATPTPKPISNTP